MFIHGVAPVLVACARPLPLALADQYCSSKSSTLLAREQKTTMIDQARRAAFGPERQKRNHSAATMPQPPPTPSYHFPLTEHDAPISSKCGRTRYFGVTAATRDLPRRAPGNLFSGPRSMSDHSIQADSSPLWKKRGRESLGTRR
jgi:hypothetical protein